MSHNASHNPLLRHRLRALLSRSPAMAMLGIPGLALAGPTGEDVIRGQADVARPDANNTIIKQYTDRAVINWQTFNVDADEYVIFNQLDASSIVLNRVLGGDASAILGHIEANGQVFLLNPQGVFFTHGASLDVQGFLASTLDMDPDAFMAGDFTLTRSAGAPDTARVINDGHITAGPGGYVVLAGDYTENTGIITAHAGTVALVAGNALTLDIEGDGLVSFTVDEAALSEAAGVRNAGSLIADGGRVIMTAKVAGDLVATAVNNEGLVRAHSIEELGGEIYLVGHGGDVANSGTLDADGESADGGGIAIYSDRDVTLADGGTQTAAGDASHEGGVIRAIAEEHLDYQKDNLIRVTGGVSGGFVEVSGHGSIMLRGIPQIGAGGTYLIDPITLNIGTITNANSVDVAAIETQLLSGADVMLVASGNITATVPSLTATGATGNLTIGIGSGSTLTGSGTINLGSMDINIGGNVLIDAGGGTGTVTATDITTSDGNITIHGHTITVANVNTTAGINTGNVVIGSSASVAGQANITGNINAAGDVTVWTDGIHPGDEINITGTVLGGGDVTLHAEGGSGATPGVVVGGTITATTGNINIFASGGSFGGNISVAALDAGSSITLFAQGADDSFGNIAVNGTIDAGGNVSLDANQTGGVSGGNIVVSSAVDAGGPVSFSATNPSNDATVQLDGAILTTQNVVIDAAGGVIGSDLVIGSAVQYANLVTLNAPLEVTNSLRVWSTELNGASVGSIGSSLTPIPTLSLNTTVFTSGPVNIYAGSITGSSLHIGRSSAGVAGISVNADIGVTGDVSMYTEGSFGGDINIQEINAGGNITLQTSPTGSGIGGNISVTSLAGGNITVRTINSAFGGGSFTATSNLVASGNIEIGVTGGSNSGGNINFTNNGHIEDAAVINLSATGGNLGGGNIQVLGASTGGLALHGGNIILRADGDLGSAGGNITISSNIAAAGAIDIDAFGGTISGGNVTAGNISTLSGAITVNTNAATGNGNISVGSITANSGMVDLRTQLNEGNIRVGGNVTGSSVSIVAGGGRIEIGTGTPESSFTAGDVTASNGNVFLNITAADMSSDGVIVAGNIVATGGDVSVRATLGQGHIHLGDYAGGVLTTPGSIAAASGNILVDATGSLAAFDAGTITGGGTVDINVWNNVSSTARLDILGITGADIATVTFANSSGTFQAGNFSGITTSLTIDTDNGGDIGSLSFAGDFNYNGSLNAVDLVGAVNIGGMLSIDAASVGIVNTDTVSAQGGIHFSSNVTSLTFGTASSYFLSGGSGDIDLDNNTLLDIADSGISVNYSAGGAISIRDGGVFNAATMNAGGDVTINALSSIGITGAISAGGQVSLSAPTAVTAANIIAPSIGIFAGAITTGALTAINGSGSAFISLTASSGDITVNGDITASGFGDPLHGEAAVVFLDNSGVGGGVIKITGNVLMTGNNSAYSNTSTFSSSGVTRTIASSGSAGMVRFDAIGNSTGSFMLTGSANLSGSRSVRMQVTSATVNIAGPVTLDDAGAEIHQTFTNSSGGVTETFTRDSARMGGASLNINGRMSDSAASVTLGDVSATGPFANVTITGSNIQTGAITVDAYGRSGEARSGSHSGVTFSSSDNFGEAQLMLDAGGGGAFADVLVTGDINVSARGDGRVFVNGDAIDVGNATLAVSASDIARSGDFFEPLAPGSVPLRPGIDLAPSFGPPLPPAASGSSSFVPPTRLTTGTAHLGTATIVIGNEATAIVEGGTLQVSGVGQAGVEVNAHDIVLAGTVTASAGVATASGTGSDRFFDSATGTVYDGTFSIDASGGLASVRLNGSGSGSINVGGAVSASGPQGMVEVNGGTVTLGGLAVAGSGVAIDRTASFASTGGATFQSDAGGPTVGGGDFAGVFANGAITINGGITVSGVGDSNNPLGAHMFLDAGSASHDITVTGDISITAAAAPFTYAGMNSSEQPFTASGSQGVGGVKIFTRFGDVSLGNVNVDAVGEGYVDVQGLHIAAGDIALDVADANITRTVTQTSCGGTSCSLERTETIADGGFGSVHLGYYGVANTGSLAFGAIDVTAGDARVEADGFIGITGGAITVSGTGGTLTQSSSGMFGTEAISYTETGNGGGAQVMLATLPGGSVNLGGAIAVTAQGRGLVEIAASNVDLASIEVAATGGSFTRTGQPAPHVQDDGPFAEHGGSGPRIDAGTITGGEARIRIGGVSSSSTGGGPVLASDVNVTGSLAVSAPGSAGISIAGNSIAVSGTLTVDGGVAMQNGTRVSEYTDSVSGDAFRETSTVTTSYGEANIGLTGSASGTISAGDISVSGPIAGGHIEGGTLNLGALALAGSGGDVNVVSTIDNLTAGTSGNFEFHGPGAITGMSVRGAGNVTLGDLSLTDEGAGGMLIAGNTVSVGDVSIEIANASYQVLDEEVFGAAMHDFTLGNAVFDIDPVTTATVGGDLNVTAAGGAHLGGEYTVTGSANVATGTGLATAIPDEVQYLFSVDDDEGGDPLALSGAWNVSATNITVSASAGDLDLAGQSLDASGGLALAASNVRLAGTSLSAGALAISATGDIRNGIPASDITAGALAITAGGSIDLSETAIAAGTGRLTDITGDAELLSLLAAEGLAAPAGGPNVFIQGQDVVMGDLALTGDYVFIKADSLALDGTVTSGNTGQLVQLAPLAAGTTMTLTQSAASGGTGSYSNTGHLGFFAGNTVALGTTGHSADITIAADGAVIDIGSTNLFVLTNGTVTGLDSVLSTGVVKDLYTLIHGEFEVPQTDEIDTSQDVVQALNDNYELDDGGGDDEEEGDEEGEDTDTDTGTEGDGDELISRDTVDEELMCQ